MRRNSEFHLIPKIVYAINIGFFAGLIWGSIRIVAYVLGFTEVVPGFLLEPFFKHNFLSGLGGFIIGLLVFTVFSIVASLIYILIFFRLKGAWPGILFGFFWFIIIYISIGPVFQLIKPIGVLSWNSIWTDGCIFVMWGTFIGYSISFEFNDMREQK
jgi:hypothetical protein